MKKIAFFLTLTLIFVLTACMDPADMQGKEGEASAGRNNEAEAGDGKDTESGGTDRADTDDETETSDGKPSYDGSYDDSIDVVIPEYGIESAFFTPKNEFMISFGVGGENAIYKVEEIKPNDYTAETSGDSGERKNLMVVYDFSFEGNGYFESGKWKVYMTTVEVMAAIVPPDELYLRNTDTGTWLHCDLILEHPSTEIRDAYFVTDDNGLFFTLQLGDSITRYNISVYTESVDITYIDSLPNEYSFYSNGMEFVDEGIWEIRIFSGVSPFAEFYLRNKDTDQVILAYEELIAVPEKPVIYIYPETETDVTVTLDYIGRLTHTYPKYDGGWRVTAHPDGTLYDENGREYYCLFWEGADHVRYDMSEGFCVKGEDTAAFLEDALPKLGLNAREANEFIIYWLPQMENNEYNLISFQDKTYTDAAKLYVDPTPDTLIRVFMTWKALDAPVEVTPQTLTSPERVGFTVVE